MFAQDFALGSIWMKGEVSNLKYHPSGHIYFSLKDSGSVMSGVMFARNRSGLAFRMQEGQTVVVNGSISVYEKGGSYQIYAKEIQLDGIGVLYQRFEALKRELEDMGMFDPMYKKPIPRYVKSIGVVTASTGAAIQDICNIVKRRNPYVQIYLYPAIVQGVDAPSSIVKGIEQLDAFGVDVMIVGRGGGSIEDLWAFNEEEVARAIFDCNTPIISAVGHETDTTIADYVADLRAPTPSAAAELAVYSYSDFVQAMDACEHSLKRMLRNQMDRKKLQMDRCEARLAAKNPMNQLKQKKQELNYLMYHLNARMEGKIEACKHELALRAEALDGVSPLKKLGNGFAFVEKDKPVVSKQELSAGDVIRVTFKDGSIKAVVSGDLL